MKKFLSFLALAGLLLTASCSKQESPVLGEDQVTISLGLEGVSATRAISDGSQVDKLVYEVYDKNGNVLSAMDKSETVVFPYTLSLPLAKGQQYTILFWAQDSDCSAYTTDNLKEVGINYSQAPNNDETRDAFYAAVDVTVTGGPQSIDVVLKRPFAQINVAVPQDEWQRAIDAGVNVSQSSVVVSEVASKINLETGKVEVAPNGISYDFANIPTETLWVDINKDKVKDADETFVYLSMSYILVADESDNGAEKNIINNATFTFKATDVNDVILSVPNLPVQRNYRTNVLGTFLVDYVDFNIVVDPIYNEPDEVYPDTDLENLYYAAANGGEVTLENNVTLDATLNVTKPMVLNLNGKTITNKQENTTTDVIVVKPGARLEINGEGTVEAVSGNDGYAVISEGELVINGGTYKSGVDANNETNAVIYARGNGKVFVNGGEFPNDNLSGFVLNKKDGDRTTTTIEVRGGTFHKFNPGNNAAEGPGTNFVAEGYYSSEIDNNGTYVVSKNAYLKDATALAELLISNKEEISVVLLNDIDLPVTSLGTQTSGSGEYKLGGDNTQNIVIDLNGKKLNITTTYWSAIGAKNDNAVFTVKNGRMTSTGNSAGTWNAWDLRFSNCNYVFEDVTFEKAVALDNVGKSTLMKGVTITDTHDTDTYGLWITSEGQTVTLENCTIDMVPANSGRGIKIDNQYVDENDEKKVTLNIKNVKFKTEQKSAIIVKSTQGAEINVDGIDISEVAADNVFAVWVDEDAAAYSDKVIVNGAFCKIEGTPSSVVDNQSDFSSAIVDNATIILGEGEYNMPATGGKDITIIGTKETVINAGAANLGGGNVVLEGVTIKAGSYKGFQHSGVVIYNNVTVVGQLNCYGQKDIFNDCTFELNNAYVWTYGSDHTEFNGCVFNTTGKAILVYNEGAGPCDVVVNGCTFNATAGAVAGAIANQNCAAIEIDNYAQMSHKVTTSNNTYSEHFSGEWRIKSYVEGAPVTVNGVEYTSLAIDGKKMTIDGSKNVTVID